MRNRKVVLGVLAIGLLAAMANLSCKGNQEHGGQTTPKEHGGTTTPPAKEHGGTVAR
ncbi:MAG: hypothetical protein HYZ88_03385 [Candidatus Omnitrophica bacterium]|nr:hypothetical protein [Candidatus Omnitrophota bacterium]